MDRFIRHAMCFALSILLPATANAVSLLHAWDSGGKPVCTVAGAQSSPRQIPDGNGGAYITWRDQRAVVSDIYLARVRSDGSMFPGWPLNGRVVCNATGNQQRPTLASDGAGGVFVAWDDTRAAQAAIYVQRITAAGAISPGWPANGVQVSNADGANRVEILANAAQEVILVWLRSGDLFGQCITGTGAVHAGWPPGLATLPISTFTGTQSGQQLCSDGAGGAFVTWHDGRSVANGFGIYALRVLANGTLGAGWIADGNVICDAVGDQLDPQIAADATGGCFVAWHDKRSDAGDLYMSHWTSAAQPAPNWQVDGNPLCVAVGTQIGVTMEQDGAGGVICAWSDDRHPAGLHSIYAQRVLANDNSAWAANGVALAERSLVQDAARLVADGYGGAIVAWREIDGSTGHGLFTSIDALGNVEPCAGTQGTPICIADGSQGIPGIAADGAGAAILCWTDTRSSDTDLYAQRVISVDSDVGSGLCGTTVGTVDFPAFHAAVRDGEGGAFVAWEGSNDLSLTRVSGENVISPGWPSNGVVLLSGASAGADVSLVPDASGGVFAVWSDNRSPQQLVYSQRVTGGGTLALGWPAGGKPIPGMAGLMALLVRAVTDGAGGAFVVSDLALTRIDGNGSPASGWPSNGVAVPFYIQNFVADGSGGVFLCSDSSMPTVRRVSATGVTLWDAVPGMTSAAKARVVADGRGGAIAVLLETPTPARLLAFRLRGDGTPDPAWPAGGVLLNATATNLIDAIGDDLGGALVSMGESGQLALQRVTWQGVVAPGWPAHGVQVGDPAQTQAATAIAPDAQGGAYAIWQGYIGSGPRSYYGARVCAAGAVAPGWASAIGPLCADIRFSGGQAVLVPDGTGNAFGVWSRRTAPGSGWSSTVHAQRLDHAGPPPGASATLAVGSPSSASAGGATLTFQTVTAAGSLTVGRTIGPPLPFGQSSVPQGPPAVYEMSTSAAFSGTIDVCITYDPTDVTGPETALRLLHYEGASTPSWVDVTTGVDAAANQICGQTTSLSPFVIVAPTATDAPGARPSLRLAQNQPNPFNPTTVIEYETPALGPLSVRVFDVRGRLVRTLVDRVMEAGRHTVVWPGVDQQDVRVGSGVYFYRLQTAERTLTRRMVLVR